MAGFSMNDRMFLIRAELMFKISLIHLRDECAVLQPLFVYAGSCPIQKGDETSHCQYGRMAISSIILSWGWYAGNPSDRKIAVTAVAPSTLNCSSDDFAPIALIDTLSEGSGVMPPKSTSHHPDGTIWMARNCVVCEETFHKQILTKIIKHAPISQCATKDYVYRKAYISGGIIWSKAFDWGIKNPVDPLSFLLLSAKELQRVLAVIKEVPKETRVGAIEIWPVNDRITETRAEETISITKEDFSRVASDCIIVNVPFNKPVKTTDSSGRSMHFEIE